MINKMPGEYDMKFASLRAFYAYMMAHPGKKLLFMGQEFAQFIEWNYAQQLDWLLLDYEQHRKMLEFVKALNKFYLENSQLWEIDYSWEGFKWISNDDNTQSIIAFRRINQSGEEIIAVCNFVPVDRHDYRIGVPVAGKYKKVFSSTEAKYGGAGGVAAEYISEDVAMHGYDNSIVLDIPGLSVTYYKVPKKRKTSAKK
jgi:1,4-alpha-glucan branching enzyme